MISACFTYCRISTQTLASPLADFFRYSSARGLRLLQRSFAYQRDKRRMPRFLFATADIILVMPHIKFIVYFRPRRRRRILYQFIMLIVECYRCRDGY